MTFTQPPIGWKPDTHGLNIDIPEPGTRGSQVADTINEAVLDNTWRRLPQDIRDAIKLGAQIGWESGSTMPDGSPNPVQIQDLEPLLNLSPKVLGYKAIRTGISRGLGFDPRLVDQAAIGIGGANLLKQGIKTAIPKVDLAAQRVGLKPRIYKGSGSGSIPMQSVSQKYEAIIKDAFNQNNSLFKGRNPKQKLIPSYENRPVYIPKSELTPFQKGEPLMTTTGGDKPVEDWIYSTEGANFDRQRSDRLGLEAGNFDNPQQERTWYAKVTYPRVLDEVLAQGGTEAQAKEIFAIHRNNFLPYAKGGSGMVASISELNRMAEKYAKGIQIRSETYTKDGKDHYRWLFKDKDGRHTRWDFEREEIDGIVKEYSKTQWAKDHIIPVKDRNRVGGGYIGADNEYNLEHLLQWLNVQKSNTTQLYPGILQEMGVPETFSEYINMKLYPQNYEGMFIPQRFKENFQKIVMAEYNEKSRGVQSGRKRAQIMNKIISIHAERFKDPVIVKGLEMLEEALGQQIAKNMEEGVAAGNEVPSWLGLFKKPPGGWNSKDPWWTSLSKDAQERYRYVYEYEERTIRGYKPTKDRYRIDPND